MNFIKNPYIKFIRVLMASSFVSSFLFVSIENLYKSIWVGVFIVFFYYMYEFIVELSSKNEDDKIFFSEKMMGTLICSLIIWILTSLITGIIYNYLIGDRICYKESFLYNKEECAIKNFRESLYENQYYPDYPSPGDYDF